MHVGLWLVCGLWFVVGLCIMMTMMNHDIMMNRKLMKLLSFYLITNGGSWDRVHDWACLGNG